MVEYQNTDTWIVLEYLQTSIYDFIVAKILLMDLCSVAIIPLFDRRKVYVGKYLI
jgi:hypothetical protein